jgi:hypothetical protein
MKNKMICTNNNFEYEDPVHYAELCVCPLSSAFPACQCPKYYRDEHEEDRKQCRREDTPEEVGNNACEAAKPSEAKRNALLGRETRGYPDNGH